MEASGLLLISSLITVYFIFEDSLLLSLELTGLAKVAGQQASLDPPVSRPRDSRLVPRP